MSTSPVLWCSDGEKGVGAPRHLIKLACRCAAHMAYMTLLHPLPFTARSRTIGARQSQIVWFPLMSVHQQAASQADSTTQRFKATRPLQQTSGCRKTLQTLLIKLQLKTPPPQPWLRFFPKE
eukprot:914956-Amphidinium_carterae.1